MSDYAALIRSTDYGRPDYPIYVLASQRGTAQGLRGSGLPEPRAVPDTSYFVSMKVSSVSSMASHHFVWCTGAWTPVTGDGWE